MRRESQEKEAIQKIGSNPTFFYSYAKRFSKLKSKMGPVINEDG